MKTSNKLILTGLVILSLAMGVYDLLLSAAYHSGNYKNPYSSFIRLPYSGFNVIDLESSTAANVKFIQGPFSVQIDSNTLEYVRIKQQANHLKISAAFERNYLWNEHPYLLVISCPSLSAVNAGATYLIGNKPYTDSIVKDEWTMRQVLIDGFKQDSLYITQDYGSTIVLSNNYIHSINVNIGKSNGSGSKIVLQASNRFNNVSLAIGHRSKLFLENAVIDTLRYKLDEDTKLVLSGNAQDLLTHIKPYRK